MSTERTVSPQISLGTDVYEAVCKRVAYDENSSDVAGVQARAVCVGNDVSKALEGTRLRGLSEERERVIGVVDEMIPASLTHDLRGLLERTLVLYDEGVIPAQTRVLAQMCGAVKDSDAALQALARMLAKRGYMPAYNQSGVLAHMLAYPEMERVLSVMLPVFVKDGLAYEPWKQALESGHHMLANASSTFKIKNPVEYRSFRDFLLAEQDVFSDGVRRYVVKRDSRGYAIPQLANGMQRAPFVDVNGDTLADVNNEGLFVDVSGRVFYPASPFRTFLQESNVSRDAWGRLLNNADGSLVYHYVDASKTLVAGMLSESYALLSKRPSLLADMAKPAHRWLGPVSTQQHRYADGSTQSFVGYDTRTSPLLEAVHVMGFLSSKPSTLWSMKLTQALLQKDEATLARMADALRMVYQWSNQEPWKSASLKENNLFTDDLLDWLEEVVAVPGLLENMLRAFENPASRPLGDLFAKHMRYTDSIDVNPRDINAPALGGFTKPVDRMQKDVGKNRSIMQRFLHLVHDTNRARFCNKNGAQLMLGSITYPFSGSGYRACELFQIDNMAVFYIQSVLGTAEIAFKDPVVSTLSNLGFMLEATSGIQGFTKKPTPQAVNRMIFAPRNAFLSALMDAPLSKDGVSLESRHPGTIFAWEMDGFYQAITPLMKAFADAGREDLLADLMSVLHTHYASTFNDTTQSADPYLPGYSAQSGVVQYEELLARALGDADVLTAQADVLKAVRNTSLSGVSGTAVVLDLLRQLLLPSWNNGISFRDGSTVAMKADGVGEVDGLSPARILYGVMRSLDDSFEGHPEEKEMFQQATQVVVEHVLDVEATSTEGARFVRRKALACTREWVGFVAQKITEHTLKGDLLAWSNSWVEDVEDLVNHPMTASMLLMTDAMVSSDEVQKQAQEMLLYALNPSLDEGRGWNGLLSWAVDAVQMLPALEDAALVLQEIAPYVHGDAGIAALGLDVLKKTYDKDTTRVLPRMLQASSKVSEHGVGGLPLEVLLDVAMKVNRVQPGSTTPMGAADMKVLLQHMHGMLTDKERGVERLYGIVAHRK